MKTLSAEFTHDEKVKTYSDLQFIHGIFPFAFYFTINFYNYVFNLKFVYNEFF